MNCIIFGASYIEDTSYIKIDKDDYIICSDGGYDNLKKLNHIYKREPDIIIGDFDSINNINFSKDIKLLKFPKDKDDTDLMLAVKKGIELGFNKFTIYGALGQRFDHQYANIQLLYYTLNKNIYSELIDENTIIFMLSANSFNNKILLKEEYKNYYISIFSYSDNCIVTSTGLFFELNDTEIKNNFPIGISNRFKNSDSLPSIWIKYGVALIVIQKYEK